MKKANFKILVPVLFGLFSSFAMADGNVLPVISFTDVITYVTAGILVVATLQGIKVGAASVIQTYKLVKAGIRG